jgi:hypothetical protein
MEHRAGWDATFSAPKSVSLTALVGGDERVREAHRESVRVALDQLERYTQARIGGNHPPETTGKFIAAKFEHDTARPPGWEKGVLGIGFQFFNLFNHPNFTFPFNNIDDPLFGQVAFQAQPATGILGAPRLGSDASARMIQVKAQLQF